MADVKKPDWPQTPDGTIDWETVFENPENGIIPALSKAPSKELLYQATVTVVKQLFTRKNDAVQVEKFIRELDLILGETEGSEDLPKMQESIIGLLRRIKNGRIKKAAEYVANKKREAALGKKAKKKKQERRAEELDKKKLATIIGMLGSGVVLAIIAVVAVIMVLSPDDEPPEETAAKTEQVTPQPEPEPEPEPEPVEVMELELSDDGYPLGQMTPDTIKKLGPIVMILQRFYWSGWVEGESARGAALVPVLIIKDDDLVNRICDYAPNIVDAINLALGRVVTGGAPASPDDLRRAGLIAMESSTKKLGSAWIRDLYLIYKSDKRLLSMSEKCQIIE